MNQNGNDSSATTIGGFMSIMVLFSMGSFLITRFATVIRREDNTLSQASFSRDLEKHGNMELDKKKFMF
jgi:hypothetical protein